MNGNQPVFRDKGTPLCTRFIDITKAYGSVDRTVLTLFGVPPRMPAVIREFDEDMRARIWTHDRECPYWFDAGQGIRQRCVVAPLLFNV